MKRGFSSLACMEATLPALIAYARGAGMDALELRLDKDDRICGLDEAQVLACLPAIRDAGLFISDLGTGVALLGYEPEKVARAKRNADLAAAVGAKGIRLFLGGSKKRVTDHPTHDLDGIVRALRELCTYAAGIGVEVWIETHTAFSTAASLRPVLDAVAMPNLRVIWDIIHSVECGEPIEESVAILGDAIAHVHVKDGVKAEDPEVIAYTLTALGAGTVDTTGAVRLLEGIGFDGCLSLEWEAAWHPELGALYKDIPALLEAYKGYLGL